jgi:hypothetical protein
MQQDGIIFEDLYKIGEKLGEGAHSVVFQCNSVSES